MTKMSFLVVFGILALVITGYIVRSMHLIRQSGPLHELATNFAMEYAVGTEGNPAITYLAIGDSTTAGIGATRLEATEPYRIASALAQQGKYVQVTQRGKSGAVVADLIGQLDQVTDLRPDVLSIAIGGNDATHLTSIESFTKDFEAVLQRIQTLNPKLVLIANTPNMGITPGIPPIAAQICDWWSVRQNQALQALHEKYQFQLVDLYQFGKLDRPDYYAQDSFHPNDSGYEKRSKVYQNAIEATNLPL